MRGNQMAQRRLDIYKVKTMKFNLFSIRQILGGRKDVTRRPAKFDTDGTIKPSRYKAGQQYAMQPPGPGRTAKKSIGTILIKSVTLEELKDLKDGQTPQAHQEARREGYVNFAAFKKGWEKIYGSWDNSTHIWRYEFVMLDTSWSLQRAINEYNMAHGPEDDDPEEVPA